MKKKLKADLISSAVIAAVGLAVSYLYLYLHEFSNVETLVEKYRMLSDCFTIPGVVFLMIGALIWISGLGALDGLGFVLHSLKIRLIPGARIDREEGYYEYVQKKREKKTKAYLPFLYVGAFFTALGIIFIILFYQIF